MGRTLAAIHNLPNSTGMGHPRTEGRIPSVWSVPDHMLCRNPTFGIPNVTMTLSILIY